MKKANTRIPEITIKENTWLTVKDPSSSGPKVGATVGKLVVELGVGDNVGAVVFGDEVVGAVVFGDEVVGAVVYGDIVVGKDVVGLNVGLVVFGDIVVGSAVTFGVGLTVGVIVGLVVFGGTGDKLGCVEFDSAFLFIRVLMLLLIVVADDSTFMILECILCALDMAIGLVHIERNKNDNKLW